MFLVVLPLHEIFLQAIAPGPQRANLLAAALGFGGGFAFRSEADQIGQQLDGLAQAQVSL